MYNGLQGRTSGNGGILMEYMDRLCIDFGEEEEKKKCRSGNDIGPACNMPHAEQGAGEEVWLRIFNFFGARACNARV